MNRRMLGKGAVFACGCCSIDFRGCAGKASTRRLLKRRERAAFRRELNDYIKF